MFAVRTIVQLSTVSSTIMAIMF